MKYEVIVIGGGISGLVTAWELSKRSTDVILLEARTRLGGRTYTLQSDDFGYADVGGAYIGPTQYHLLKLIKDLELDHLLYGVYAEQTSIYYLAGKRYVSPANKDPTFWNPLMLMDVNNLFRTIDKLGETIPSDAPWNSKDADNLDTMTMKQFIEQTCWTRIASDVARLFVQIIVACEPHECSLLWFLWYVKQCGGVKRIASIRGGGQEMKMLGGINKISDALVDKLGERVQLSSQAVRIEQDKEVVRVFTLDGREFLANHVVLAMAPSMISKILFNPQLPPTKHRLLHRMPMGTAWKIQLFYDTAFWRKNGFSGIIHSSDFDIENPFVYTLDDTKPTGDHPAIVGFVTGDRARKFAKLEQNVRKNVCAQYLYRAFGSPLALQPRQYVEYDWSAEQFSTGCWTSICAPGVLTRYQAELSRPFGLIHFAGTETASNWSGYINGAVQSGQRAAFDVLLAAGRASKDDKHFLVEGAIEPVVPVMELKYTLIERILPSVPCFLTMMSTGIIFAAALSFAHQRDILSKYAYLCSHK